MAETSSLPRSTFAKLSPHEFLVANLQAAGPAKGQPLRTNGRAPHQARAPQVNSGSLSHAHGSAVVRNGDTTVICGVRGEILPVENIPNYRPRSGLDGGEGQDDGPRELRDYDLLVPNIELATGSAPQFLPGVPPTTLAQTLSTRVYSLLHSCGLVDAADLRIWHAPPEADDEEKTEDEGPELKAYWTLYIDLLFISLDGNPFDAAWAAVVAALRDTKLPRPRWDADREMVVCSREDSMSLSVRGLPIACSAAVLLERERGSSGNHWALLDPDRLEEDLCDETFTVVVDRSQGETRIRGISKHGGAIVGPRLLRQFVPVAERRWDEFRAAMEQKPHVPMTLS